jgi:hypothetical protein
MSKNEGKQTYLVLPDGSRQAVRELSFERDAGEGPPIADLIRTSLPFESGMLTWTVRKQKSAVSYRCHVRRVYPPFVSGLDRIIRVDWDGTPELIKQSESSS